MSTNTMFETYTGAMIDLHAPDPELIELDDIAHPLSLICRYTGHIPYHYSVAQHALLVRQLVIRAGMPELGFAALHHDSHEAYLNDIATPLKAEHGASVERLERRFDRAIGKALGIDPEAFADARVKFADWIALRMEARRFKRSRGEAPEWGPTPVPIPRSPAYALHAWSPNLAERAFREAHYEEVARCK